MIAICGKVVQITFSVSCLYKKTTTDFVNLFTDERIPMPARASYIYQLTDAGNFGVIEGRVAVGGIVDAGKTAFVSLIYLAV